MEKSFAARLDPRTAQRFIARMGKSDEMLRVFNMPRGRPENRSEVRLMREPLAECCREFGVDATLGGWARYQMGAQIATAETIPDVSGYA